MSKSEFIEEIKQRTKQLAINIVLFYNDIPKTESSRIIGRQLLRSATSVAANYRATCLARSKRDFFAKISIVVEEADETLFWLEMIRDTNMASKKEVEPLMNETREICKIVTTARKNTKI